jgi:hypothetical protein
MFFLRKKIMKHIAQSAWSHLVAVHKVHIYTGYHEMMCVERKGGLEDGTRVTFLRVFSLKEAERKGVIISGWETFDEYPDLIMFDGYLTRSGRAFLRPKRSMESELAEEPLLTATGQ